MEVLEPRIENVMSIENSLTFRINIRKVLLEVWDPIGIRAVPQAQEEYDDYLGRITQLLVEEASDQEIVEYLYLIETQTLGLPEHDKALLLPAARALKKIMP
jgi:hypothetical protein